MNIKSMKKLANGVGMPYFGLGVWQAKDGQETSNSVKWAIAAGYISIDTAAIYKNEESVGQAIKASGMKREDLFVTTKVWNDDQGYEETLAAYETSLAKLGLECVDLYLIHWPVGSKFKETWRAMEKLYTEGKVRAIGVSNFQIHHLEALMETARITPMVNQVELHPQFNQAELRDYCKKQQIAVEAWSPLGSGRLLKDSRLQKIADAHGKSIAQVILRWDLQHGIITIPKSVHENRVQENAAIFDFRLTQAEMDLIDSFDNGERFGTNPDKFNDQ